VPYDTDRTHESDCLGLTVELREVGATLRARGSVFGIDRQASHLRQVDHDAAVARRESRHAMASSAHGDDQVVLTREADRGDDVVDRGAASDQRRAPVGHAVPDNARLVVLGMVWPNKLALEAILES
jgi:hypothetical protein